MARDARDGERNRRDREALWLATCTRGERDDAVIIWLRACPSATRRRARRDGGDQGAPVGVLIHLEQRRGRRRIGRHKRQGAAQLLQEALFGDGGDGAHVAEQ